MKKATGIAIAAAVILSAASCGGSGASAPAEPGTSVSAAAQEIKTDTDATAATTTTTVTTTTTTTTTTSAVTEAAANETTTELTATTSEAATKEEAAIMTATTETTAPGTEAETTRKPNIFDSIGVTTSLAANEGIDDRGNKYVDVVFDSLPSTYEEFIRLPQAELSNVFDTAAMTVLALCFYPSDPELSIKMYEYVSGPRTINNAEYSFIKDRFRDYDYVPRSYFTGAVPSNDYKPTEPYTVRVTENPYSYENEGYAKMFLRSGGADSERFVMLRKGKDGKWYLWEQFILVGIREPESNDPWA